MKSKSISLKKLYQWESEFRQWKQKEENNHGATDLGISVGLGWISDYLRMVREKIREESERIY